MKKLIKPIIEDWLPPVLNRYLRQSADYFQFLSYPDKEILQKNKKLKGIGQGKRAFLLATGPSIRQENLRVLADEDCFSLSNFFLHNDIEIIKPKFQFFAPYHKPLILENYVEWLNFFDQKLSTETKVFLGHTTKRIVEDFNLFPARKIYYLYLSRYPSLGEVDITKPLLSPQSIPLMVLPVLIYMDYKEIYLLGCDHTTWRDHGNFIEHFYNKEQDIRINAANEKAFFPDPLSYYNARINLFFQYKHYVSKSANKNSRIINLSLDSDLKRFNICCSTKLKDLFKENKSV